MLELDSHWFYGSADDFVLILAGIHASEQSGVEVAHWVRVKLAARATPTRLGAVVIPEVFPARGKKARTDEWRTGSAAKWREYDEGQTRIYPNRQFPPPGRSLAFLSPGPHERRPTKMFLKDRQGKDLLIKRAKVRLLAETEYIIRCVEGVKPVRIVSVHGKRDRTATDLEAAGLTEAERKNWDGHTAIPGINFPGIFVDPRYELGPACPGFDVEACKFNRDLDPAFPKQGSNKRFDSANSPDGRKDDALALAAASAVPDRALVAGNHVDEAIPIVHYAKEGATPEAFSLGDWGPVDVAPTATGTAPGSRRGAPVFTIEVKEDHESWAFMDGVQVMDEDGKPLVSEPTPEARAVGQKGRAVTKPQKFDPKRSKQLQAYAQAIVDTILELP